LHPFMLVSCRLLSGAGAPLAVAGRLARRFLRGGFLMDASVTARPGRTAQAAKLDALLAEARTRLIETGTRNRLVHTNRRAKRPSTLAIAQDDSDALFQRLVHDGASVRFRSD